MYSNAGTTARELSFYELGAELDMASATAAAAGSLLLSVKAREREIYYRSFNN